MRRALVCLALLAACKSPSAPSTFGVNITLEASSLSSAVRGQIMSAALSVTGDETYSRTFDIRSAISSGEVRFRYIPGIQNGTLTLAIDALGSDGTVIGRAPPTTVTITAGHSVAATLTLSDATTDDMGTSTDDGGDGGTCDPGMHSCAGTCVDDRSIDHCGTSCSACPVTANATAATCDGTSCGLQCEANYHICGGACVSATDPNSCNMSCTPCTAPAGGSATCDGTSCGGSCPSGQKLCVGTCIATSMACSGTCPSGTHDCSDNCFDDTSVNSCGLSCTPCPVPANATMATCTGATCGFVCTTGYKVCGAGCIPTTACCTTSDCTQPANGVATCDTSTNICVIACNSNYTKCGTQCIPTTGCCMNSDCPQPTNGTGICDANHMCTASCNTSGNTVCAGACVDTTSDNNNCGSCGTTCGGQCALSRCVVVLASSQNGPDQIAVDGTSAYWTDYGDILTSNGSIMKVTISGGTPITLAGSQLNPLYLVIDTNTIYWTTEGMFGSGTVSKIAKTGGSVAMLATSQFTPGGITVDSTNVYFTNNGYMSTMGNVNQVPIGGGTIVQLATAKSCSAVVAYSGYVYWPDGNGALMRTPIGGGTTVQVASGAINSVATDGTYLYWNDTGSGTANDGDIKRMQIGGTTPTPIVSNVKYPQRIVVDSGNLYWITGDLQIMKVAVTGGTTTMVTAGPANFLALDGGSIYWTSTSSVLKASPK